MTMTSHSLPPFQLQLSSDYPSTSFQLVSLRVWAKTEIMKRLEMVGSYKSGATMLLYLIHREQNFPWLTERL